MVFDHAHSDTQLLDCILRENRRTYNSIRATGMQVSQRHASWVKEAKSVLQMSGDLSKHAGLSYVRATRLSDLLSSLRLIAGADGNARRSHFASDLLPHDLLTESLTPSSTLGGTHPLSPEFLYNARRPSALSAGLVCPISGELLDIREDQLDVSNYWDGHRFRHENLGGIQFQLNTDPSILHVFDLPFPRKLVDALAEPSEDLLAGFSKLHMSDTMNIDDAVAESDPEAAKRAFRRHQLQAFCRYMAPDRDADADTLNDRLYDAMDPAIARLSNKRSEDEEMALDALTSQTTRIYTGVVCGLKQSREREALLMEDGPEREAFVEETNRLFFKMTGDLAEMHFKRFGLFFVATDKRETIPPGWVAWYDSLLLEVAHNDGSASIAFGKEGVQLMHEDRCALGEICGWITQIFHDVAQIDGRQNSVIMNMLFTIMETFQQQTYMTLLAGAKASGKSLRSDRVAIMLPEGVTASAGTSSARAGFNGNSKKNGRGLMYDELPADMVASSRDPTSIMRTEYLKQILTLRRYHHSRTQSEPGADGVDRLASVDLVTRHDETHIICTNQGCAFMDPRDPNDPDESRHALCDRSVYFAIRDSGKNVVRDATTFNRLLELPFVDETRHKFRLFMSLVAVVMMATRNVAFLSPDLKSAIDIISCDFYWIPLGSNI